MLLIPTDKYAAMFSRKYSKYKLAVEIRFNLLNSSPSKQSYNFWFSRAACKMSGDTPSIHDSAQEEYSDSPAVLPSTSSQEEDDEPNTKQQKPVGTSRGRITHQMRFPIILPKVAWKPSATHGAAIRLITAPQSITPSTSDPRPLITLLDRTEFRSPTRTLIATPPIQKPRKCYYTELNDIRREFGIPETFDTTKPNTISAVALSESLQLLQRLRGENKFLHESIQKKQHASDERSAVIVQVRRATDKTSGQIQLLRTTLQTVEEENARISSQLN